MKQPILTVPEDKLRQICTPFESFGYETQTLVLDLEDSLKKAPPPGGVGLALPQIGILKRGFATYIEHKLRIYLNPKILDLGDETTLGPNKNHPLLEGCLSIPQLYGPVPRSKKIKVEAQNERGESKIYTLTNFQARVFLHEYDHLDGILFTDYTKKEGLPLYFHDQRKDQLIELEDPSQVIKW
jgi:peptide deformylase